MKPVLLDLFCGAGGASMGYARSGFEVIGIDNVDQPNYPFRFIKGDALDTSIWPTHYDVIHASPPCQDRSTVAGRARKAGTKYPQLIAASRDALRETGKPYVIENVVGARDLMVKPWQLCGSSFGLDVRRHRLFESEPEITPLPCDHAWQTPRFRSLDSRMVAKGRLASVVGVHGHCNYAGEFEIRCKAMGIDWMSSAELAQAIPPAYTQYIGNQLQEMEVAA